MPFPPITRGEVKSYVLTIKDPITRALIDLTGRKLRATIRLNDVVQFVKRSAAVVGGGDDEIEIVLPQTGASLGTCKLKLAQADTINLEPCLLDGDLWVDDATCALKFSLPVEQAQTREFPNAESVYGTGRPLIVIAGQSQALGHGDTFWLDNGPGLVTPYKAVPLNYQLGADAVSPIVWTFGATGPLQPFAAPGSPGMGYELSLGRALYDLGSAPIIGKFAVNGAGLNAHFLQTNNYPASPIGAGNLFGQLVNYITALQLETGSTLAVLVWDQGGTDAVDSGPAAAYQANLAQFVNDLRDHFGNFALVVTKLNEGIPLGVCAFRETVRAAQVAYVSSAENAFLVNTDVVPVGGTHVDSSVHFDANSCASIGYMLARTISPLIPRTMATVPTFIGTEIGDSGTGALKPRWGAEGEYQAGDIAILAVTGGQTNAAHSLSDAQGFVQIATVDSLYTTLHQRLTLYWCRATSSNMTPPTVADVGDFHAAKIFIFRGCVASGSPVDVSATGANNTYGTAVALPGATTLTDRTLVAMFSGAYCAAQSNTLSIPSSQDFPAIATRSESGFQLGGGNFQILDLVTAEKRVAGAFSAVNLTTPFSGINANITIALKPA